jgi:hypothetical protein
MARIKPTQHVEPTRNDILYELLEIAKATPDGRIIKVSDKLKALDVISKIIGLYKDSNIEITNNISNDKSVDLSHLSVEDLLKIIENENK